MIAIQREFRVSAKPELDDAVKAILDEAYVDIVDKEYKYTFDDDLHVILVVFHCLTNEDRFMSAIEALDEDEGIHAIVTY